MIKRCKNCGKEFITYPSKIKGGKGIYCSLKCSMKSPNRNKTGIVNGPRHPNWKGGRKISEEGYILITCVYHPYKDRNNQVREHRLIMEKYIKRFLLPTEIVHHINGIRDDNKIENLILLSNAKEHNKLHKEDKI